MARTMATLWPSGRPSALAAQSGRCMEVGQLAIPSAQAATIRFWATRPASKPLPPGARMTATAQGLSAMCFA